MYFNLTSLSKSEVGKKGKFTCVFTNIFLALVTAHSFGAHNLHQHLEENNQ
jgi:hypothetical protein